MATLKHILFTGIFCAFFGVPTFAQDIPPMIIKDSVYNYVGLTKVPEYPGGMKQFYAHISNNFQYPDIDSTFTAKVYASFVVEQDGSMSSIKILRDPGFGLGAETVRILQSVPEKWIPGEQNGTKVRASYNLPIALNFAEIPKKKKKSNK